MRCSEGKYVELEVKTEKRILTPGAKSKVGKGNEVLKSTVKLVLIRKNQ